MATKTETSQHSELKANYAGAGGKAGGMGSENMVIDESGSDQTVEEVPGTTESGGSAVFIAELTQAEKHRPVCNPKPSTAIRPESIEGTEETDPTVDASFSSIASLNDEQEFWGAISRAIGPLIINTVKNVGTAVVKTGVQKLSPKLVQLLKLEGFSEAAIQRLESSQQESGSESSGADQQEFWGAIAGALVPVLMPHAKKLAGAAVKKGSSWVKKIFESSQMESGAETEALSRQLENLFLQQAVSSQYESSGDISAEDQREFWGSLVRKLVPVLSPIAKAAAGAAVHVGTSLVKTGIKKVSPALAQILKSEGFSEAAIQRLESSQQESGSDGSGGDQREFWGAIAGALVPVLMPHAKKLAGAAVKKGSSWVKKIFESSQMESGAETEALSQQLEYLFLEQAESSQYESSGNISAENQREFWGSLVRKLVPVLSPIAKAAARVAVNAGTSWIRQAIESSQQESSEDSENLSQQLEEMFIQQSSQHESSGMVSADEEREFWGALVRKLVPVLSPIAKAAAGAAVNVGTTLVKTGIKKVSPALAHLIKLEGFNESAIQQLESSQQESGSGDQQEFWGAIVRKLVPILKPYANKLGRVAVDVSGTLVTNAIMKTFKSSPQEAGEDAMFVSETVAQNLEALEVIIGNDDRKQELVTTQVPYRRICHLAIKAADGSSFLGTGFFIGPRTIITAGHCVYMREHGGWPQQIIVSPGRNLSSRPFGQFIATRFCSVQGWIQNEDRDCDYGVIQLGRNDKVPAQIGCFGFGVFSDQALSNMLLTVAGYPGDKPSGTMMRHSLKPTTINPTTIVYNIDTVGGQSGSAVYDQNHRVVAIHTNGALSGNSGTRITQSVFNNLNMWRMDLGS